MASGSWRMNTNCVTNWLLDLPAYQRWEGDRIVEEKFFYDPQQLQPRR